MIWLVGGALLIALGFAVLLDIRGAAGGLSRLWARAWDRYGSSPRPSPRFVRFWFGGLLVVIGASWIYAGS
jgi:hypothetical protein